MNKLRARSDSEKQVRKDKILQSAKKVFSLHGYQPTTIKMITEDARLSPASFYLYYESKLEAYRALNLMGIDILEKMITESLGKQSPGAAKRLRAVSGAYFRFFTEERDLYNIIAINHLGVREFFSDLDMVPVLEGRTKVLLDLVASIIGEGIKSGEFRKVDPWKTAVTLWGMMDGVLILEVKQSVGYVDATIEELLRHMMDLVLKALEA
ncbi:MAG: TetR/AcrR family transcriptional regulator [Spirochaetes bacterium]|nr:MAG: TetR/AcrR family transcriptional regulator [Spirochaetota bacterium]